MPKIIRAEIAKPKIKLGTNRDVTSPYDDKLYNTDTLYNKDQYYFDAVQAGIYPKLQLVDGSIPKLIRIEGGGETYYIITEAGMPIGLLLTLTYPDRVIRT